MFGLALIPLGVALVVYLVFAKDSAIGAAGQVRWSNTCRC